MLHARMRTSLEHWRLYHKQRKDSEQEREADYAISSRFIYPLIGAAIPNGRTMNRRYIRSGLNLGHENQRSTAAEPSARAPSPNRASQPRRLAAAEGWAKSCHAAKVKPSVAHAIFTPSAAMAMP